MPNTYDTMFIRSESSVELGGLEDCSVDDFPMLVSVCVNPIQSV